MKKWAVKRQDGTIYVIQCKSSPESFVVDSENDTVLNEITDSNPLPSKAFMDAWKDNGSGDVEIDLDLIKTKKKELSKAERDAKIKAWDETEQEYTSKVNRGTRLSEDVSAEQANLDAIEDYKHELRELGATIDSDIDALDTVSDVESYEPTWPNEPTL